MRRRDGITQTYWVGEKKPKVINKKVHPKMEWTIRREGRKEGVKMGRRVFFSFHKERDDWRANQVRNSWVTKPDRESAGFYDAAEWEEIKKKGQEAIKRWIDKQLEGTSVTVVLIGAETSSREWVKYEIKESHKKGNGIIGIYIHNLKDKNGLTDKKGDDKFGEIDKDKNGNSVYFWQLYPTYDWVNDDGYNKLGDWVEKAAQKAGR